MSAYINIKKKKTQIDYWKKEKEKDSRNQSTVAATVLHSANTLDAQYWSIVAA